MTTDRMITMKNMDNNIIELLCSDDGNNNMLGVQLAFGQYGKSYETFVEIIRNSIINEDEQLTDLMVSEGVCINFCSDYTDYGNECILCLLLDNKVNNDWNLLLWNDNSGVDTDDFIKLHDISNCSTDFRIDNLNYLNFSNHRVDTFLRRLYHFLTYWDLL